MNNYQFNVNRQEDKQLKATLNETSSTRKAKCAETKNTQKANCTETNKTRKATSIEINITRMQVHKMKQPECYCYVFLIRKKLVLNDHYLITYTDSFPNNTCISFELPYLYYYIKLVDLSLIPSYSYLVQVFSLILALDYATLILGLSLTKIGATNCRIINKQRTTKKTVSIS